jgi:hypothetical protein
VREGQVQQGEKEQKVPPKEGRKSKWEREREGK